MNESNNQDYYEVRAATSRRLAAKATSPAIAAIHEELARRYEFLAEQLHPPIMVRLQA